MSKGKFVDITGKKFGRLTVIKRVENYISPKYNRQTSQWLCKCSCGNEKTLLITNLNNGTVKSCGCLLKERTHGGNLNPNRKEQYAKYVYRDYKRNAKDRGIKFNIPFLEFSLLIYENCFYCNSFPTSKCHHKGVKKDNIKHNGIDRIDPDKGYFSDNIVTCCSDCNYAKKNMNIKEFFEFIKKIYLNLKLKNKI